RLPAAEARLARRRSHQEGRPVGSRGPVRVGPCDRTRTATAPLPERGRTRGPRRLRREAGATVPGQVSGTGPVRVTREGPGSRVARITIDRPPLNVLDIPAIRALREAVDSLTTGDGGPDLLVLEGGGERGFSAGVDIKDHTPDRVEEMLTS